MSSIPPLPPDPFFRPVVQSALGFAFGESRGAQYGLDGRDRFELIAHPGIADIARVPDLVGAFGVAEEVGIEVGAGIGE